MKPSEAAAWLARNAVDCLPEGELERKLATGRQLRVKLGIDPTAPDIHLGFTVVLTVEPDVASAPSLLTRMTRQHALAADAAMPLVNWLSRAANQ